VLCFSPWSAGAAGPDHPVITEIYQDPPGPNDGPIGRDLANAHQEYIEIHLPTATELDPALSADTLRLTLYNVEGDASSGGLGMVNYRIDLPTFDLIDGVMGLPRPPSGVVVLGWVDYVGNPATDLAGTPSTRVGLVEGGITAANDFTFIAINGAEFSGTTNFPVPEEISLIHAAERSQGLIENGSSVYLLVNRDDPGYARLFDALDSANVPPTVLGTSALLDGVSANDDSKFDVLEQPYAPPTGDDIDLETVLPLNGAFSRLAPQLEETHQGHARLLVDVAKTTDDADPTNDDPVADALGAYRSIEALGPLGPTPGRVHFAASPSELSVADASLQVFEVLLGTTGRPGVLAANAGGSFSLTASATPSASSNPSVMSFAAGDSDTAPGQTRVHPTIEATPAPGALDGQIASTTVALNATPASGGDPPVVSPAAAVSASYRVIDPVTGLNFLGQPFQATTLVALQGLPAPPVGSNEFATTSLAAYVDQHLGSRVQDERGNGLLLLDPGTDLGDPTLIDQMEDDMPENPLLFINPASPAGLDDLLTTVDQSAEQFVSGSYDDSFDGGRTAVQAVEFTISETLTSGGSFTPSERVHYVDARGLAGVPTSGLSDVTTTRGFELALLDSNVQQFGTLETGSTDDFGLVVEIGRVRPTASVEPGEFVFLSFTGGLEGADVDTLDVAPHANRTVIVYVDLDRLDSQLGAETIRRLFVVDGSGGGTVNVIEAFSLNALHPLPWRFHGVAEGGTIDLVVSGVALQVVTTTGQSSLLVAQAIAAAINGSPGLAALGIGATALNSAVTTNGEVDSLVIDDPGIFHTMNVPSFSPLSLALLVLTLAGAGAARLRAGAVR
jgi:hypothetical protein